MKTWRRLLRYLLAYRARLALALLAMLILALTTGLYPVLLDLLTSVLIEGPAGAQRVLGPALARLARGAGAVGLTLDTQALARFAEERFALLFGLVVLVKALSQAVRFYEMGMIAQWVVRDLRADLFRGVLRQSEAFFGAQSTGFLVSRVVNDVAQVERAATYAVPVLVGDALKVLSLSTVCFLQYPELSLVALVVTPLAALPIVRFGRLLKRYARRGQEELGHLTHRVTESVGGIRVVHAYGQEPHELERFQGASEAYVGVMKKSVLVRALQTPAMELVGVAALLLTTSYALREVERGLIRPGEVVGFLLALVLLYEPLKAIGRLNGIVVPGLASAERVFELVDRPPEVADRPGARPLLAPPEEVRFSRVSFRYRPELPAVLSGLDLSLPRGKMIALVGPSGGGKSTVASLLLRYFDVSEGAVLVDGVDLRELTLCSLRARIALVAQETYLFHDSVRANIAYGKPGASEAEIVRAAQQAYAHEFICALPQGYDTPVGERGVQLSGGQRQRIAIARAFLRDAPILVLDEATSALDVESEREVQRALDALLSNRTALVIAHRLSTIRQAHEIVVLEGGVVVERGAHDELLARRGSYARLVAASEVGPATRGAA